MQAMRESTAAEAEHAREALRAYWERRERRKIDAAPFGN